MVDTCCKGYIYNAFINYINTIKPLHKTTIHDVIINVRG